MLKDNLWVEAFIITIFLLNWLPSSSLQFNTPYFMLHGTHLDYTSLWVFGSKCFPYTWHTRNHKFDPKTVLCVFVGYNEKYKGYNASIHLVVNFSFLVILFCMRLFFHLNLHHFLLLPHMFLIYLIFGYLILTLFLNQVFSHKCLHR
jgi:hypothetical protein